LSFLLLPPLLGIIDGRMVVNASEEEMKRSSLDLVYAGNESRTLMIEAGGKQVRGGWGR